MLMYKLQKNIDKQIEFNKGKNLFHINSDSTMKFTNNTVHAIENLNKINKDHEDLLIDYATDKALIELCRINQYFAFNKQSKNDLRNIYVSLFSNIKSQNVSTETISKLHYCNLKLWLLKTNSFVKNTYSQRGQIIEPVVCSEYRAELQIEILHIDISTIMEPVLDIGCGRQGELANYLKNKGFETFGFDRFSFNNSNLKEADWLEYKYGIKKWGTIISNLGFSNHFNHHHLREDGNYIEYARKYMDILQSLKIGGSFYYAPDLPFIEQFLDNDKFQTECYNIAGFKYKTVKITRLK